MSRDPHTGAPSQSANRRSLLAACLAAAFALALLLAPAADAAPYAKIGAMNQAAAGYSAPRGMAVDTSTGYAFVTSFGDNTIRIYKPNGTATEPFGPPSPISTAPIQTRGIAVDSSSGDVYATYIGLNEVQQFVKPTSFQYKLEVEGVKTAPIEPTASNAEIRGALEVLVGVGNVLVGNGSPSEKKKITFQNSSGNKNISPIKVYNATGDVFVENAETLTNGASGGVLKYHPDNHTSPTTYTAVTGPSFVSPPEGAGAGKVGSFGSTSVTTHIAVDPTGSHDILVADPSQNKIKRFSSSGTFIEEWNGSPGVTAFGGLQDLAVTSQGKVIVADVLAGTLRILRFDGNGTNPVTLTAPPYSGSAPLLAVKQGTGEYFVTSKAVNFESPIAVYRYSAAGAAIENFSPSAPALEGGAHGLAVVNRPGPRVYLLGETSSGGEAILDTFAPPSHSLTITPGGTGSGTVKCNVGSGPETCDPNYEEGQVVTLTAVPNPGSIFAGWSAVTGSGAVTTACAGTTSPCEVKMDANVSATASFNPVPTKLLNITIVGSGSVECKLGAGAFGPCAASYNQGDTVKLKAVPNLNQSFSGWSAFAGSGTVTTPCTGSVVECEVKLDNNVTGTATFAQITHTLNVTTVGSGSVECKLGAGAFGPCAASYNQGDTVKLKAVPAAGNAFSPGWSAVTGSGAVTTVCAGTTSPCEVKMDANVSATATFSPIKHTLGVTLAGTGTGSVVCNGGACAATYNEGDKVTLLASPASGSTFAGWSGAGCTGTGSCVVTISADTTVVATFNAAPPSGGSGGGSPAPPPPSTVTCVVPKLAKKSLKQAKSALKAAHCALGKVTKPKAKKGKKLGPLVVKSSKPSAGATVPAGSKIDLKLGPKPKKQGRK